MPALAAAFRELTPSDQDAAFALINGIRLDRLAGDGSETGAYIAALRQVAEAVGHEPTVDDYKRVRGELAAEGIELPEIQKIIRHFTTWRRAKEAVGLASVTTSRKVEARFAARRAGKRRTFTEGELREALTRCASELGRVPVLAEYEAWRERELALARARGDRDFRIASASTFRRRWLNWERALLRLGYPPAEVKARLEPRGSRRDALKKVDRYSDETLGEILLCCAHEIGGVPLVDDFNSWRERELKRTRRKNLVLPSDSPYRRRWVSWRGALLHFGFTAADIDARLLPGRDIALANLTPYQMRRA